MMMCDDECTRDDDLWWLMNDEVDHEWWMMNDDELLLMTGEVNDDEWWMMMNDDEQWTMNGDGECWWVDRWWWQMVAHEWLMMNDRSSWMMNNEWWWMKMDDHEWWMVNAEWWWIMMNDGESWRMMNEWWSMMINDDSVCFICNNGSSQRLHIVFWHIMRAGQYKVIDITITIRISPCIKRCTFASMSVYTEIPVHIVYIVFMMSAYCIHIVYVLYILCIYISTFYLWYILCMYCISCLHTNCAYTVHAQMASVRVIYQINNNKSNDKYTASKQTKNQMKERPNNGNVYTYVYFLCCWCACLYTICHASSDVHIRHIIWLIFFKRIWYSHTLIWYILDIVKIYRALS